MHLPPAVSWNAAASRLQRWVVGFIVLVLLLVQLACAWGASPLSQQGWMWLLSLLALCVAIYGVYKTPSGILCWTGARWIWEGFPHNAPACVVCVLELPFCVLLRLSTRGRPVVWLWLESGGSAGRWLALRRALASAHTLGVQAPGSAGLVSRK